MNTVHTVFPKLYANISRCSRTLAPTYHRDVLASNSLCYRVQQSRNTLIFERMFPVAVCDKNRTGPLRPHLKRREFVYKMVENTLVKPAGDMDVILATDVDGLGLQGDIVHVSKNLARIHMLPVGVAEYVTPQTLEKYEPIRKLRQSEKRQTMTALQTSRKIVAMTLPIPMNATSKWTLNKTHVRVAFRMVGVHLNEDCIDLPEEPITEHQTITVQVTINGMDKVPVRAIIYPYNKAAPPVSLPPVWASETEIKKFSIEESIAEAARRMHATAKTEKSSAAL